MERSKQVVLLSSKHRMRHSDQHQLPRAQIPALTNQTSSTLNISLPNRTAVTYQSLVRHNHRIRSLRLVQSHLRHLTIFVLLHTTQLSSRMCVPWTTRQSTFVAMHAFQHHRALHSTIPQHQITAKVEASSLIARCRYRNGRHRQYNGIKSCENQGWLLSGKPTPRHRQIPTTALTVTEDEVV